MLRRWGWALCAAWVMGCRASEPSEESSGNGRQSLDDGTCYPPECVPEEAPRRCPAGPEDCPWDQGCREGVCGACETRADCGPMEVCREGGACGACERDNECGLGWRCVQGVCLARELPTWRLEVDSSDWRALVQDPYARDLAKPCRLEVGGVRYDEGCEVSLHGGTSREFRKKSLRLELPDEAPYPGYARKTNLRAEYNDPSFLRNWLGLQVFRRLVGAPTPRARFVRLELNGEYYGLMAEMERIGGKFLRDHGRDDLQSMYEPDPDRHLFADGASAFVPLPDPALYPLAYQKHAGVEGDYSDLRALIEEALAGDWEDSQALGQVQTRRLREVLDVYGFVDYLAAMALLQNHDHVKKNSYLSWQRGEDGRFRWEVYPWDLDLTLGCLWDEASQDTLCDSLTLDEDPIRGRIPEGEPLIYPFLPFANLMIHLVAEDPALRGFLGWRVCQMLDDRFWWERLPAYLDAMEVYVREAAAEDRRDLNETAQDHATAVEQVRTFLRKREQFLRGYFACPL